MAFRQRAGADGKAIRMMLTRTEIRKSLEVAGPLSGDCELSDPVAWADLLAHPEATTRAVQARLADGRSPHRGEVFRWPKEAGGYRPMAWLDPLDQMIYRGTVGRLLTPIAASVDDTSVLSSRVVSQPPGWQLERWRKPIGERRRRGLEMLVDHKVMGMLDVRNFFPSVTRKALEDTVGVLPIHQPTFDFVLDWLDELNEVSGIGGLPTGHQPSHVLANGVLVPCDDLLSSLGVPFVRYVDDTWFFVDSCDEFEEIVEAYGRLLSDVGLKLHPTKTTFAEGAEALNAIERFAITYLEDMLDEPGPEGRVAGLELFEWSMEEPAARKTELRRSLRALAMHRDPRPLEILRGDRDLLRVAPRHWVKYLCSMMAAKPTRRLVGEGWLVKELTRTANKDDAYTNLLFMEVASKVRLSKDLGQAVFDSIATNRSAWCAPLRVRGAHVWGRSGAYNPNVAVEQVELHGDLATRRAFALTLRTKSSDPKAAARLRRVRLADPELEPTARWLEAA